MTDTELYRAALSARDNAWAPYSGFSVGAALQTSCGKVFTGCNIENAAFSSGLCAERTALAAAVSAGNRDFSAIAIAGGPAGKPAVSCPPCGVCRQMLREFCCPEDFHVIFLDTNSPGQCKRYTLAQLLPHSFGPDTM